MFNPMLMLQARAAAGGAENGAPPSPSPTAGVPPPAPPRPDPPVGSGGIGGAMTRAFSGEGIFGTPDMSIDPSTGMPREDQRRATNQSIMKMGMMLMVAGMRNTDQGRTALLSKIPDLMDTSDQVNSFAKNRLEMAKLKIAEREALANEVSSGAINRAIIGGETAPVPGASVNPGGAAPVLDPSAPPSAVPTPPAPVAPVAPPPVGPVAGGPVAPPVGPPQPAGPVPGPAGPVPGPAPAAGPALPLDKSPPPPPMPTFQVPSAIALMPAGTAKTQAYITAQREAMKAPYYSEPYIDSKMGKVVVDEYVAGRKVGRKVQGDVPTEQRDVPLNDGEGTIERQTVEMGTGRVTKKETIRDPGYSKGRDLALERFDKESQANVKEYNETAKNSVANYERLGALAKDVDEGKAITGTLAGARTWVANTLASLGVADDETNRQLQTGQLVGQQLRKAAGEFAKQYYGPQISENDVKNAEAVLGAAMSNNKKLVADALREMQKEARKKVENYNEKADRHNETLGKSKYKKYLDTEQYRVPRVDYDFGAKPDLTPNRDAAGNPIAPQVQVPSANAAAIPGVAAMTATPEQQAEAAKQAAIEELKRRRGGK